jgi:alkylhydroperoxidase family enzyme
MAWIKTIEPAQAEGLLKRQYEAAIERAGKLFNVIRIQSLRPRVMRSSTQLYTELMQAAEGGIGRAQREMIAVVVSRANDCHY